MNLPGDRTEMPGQTLLLNTRYLVVTADKSGLIKMLDCPGVTWCVNGLHVGRQLPEVLQAIVDSCGDSSEWQLFPYAHLSETDVADVHILNRETDTEIVLHDVSGRFEGAQQFQQKAYDTSLLMEQKEELNRLLDKKRQEADRANEAKSRFIETMSNEFRSPISSIMAHAEALQSEHRDAREPAAIQRAAWYLLTLLENLLEQARTDDRKRELSISSIEVPVLLNDMRNLFESQASSKMLTLEVHHSDDANLVQADELCLRQVLVNLLNNSIRYTREGSIRLECQRQDDEITFSVTDTGIGIAESDIEQIFMPFTRIAPGGDKRAGLGLTVSRHLVEAMSGELEVQSTPGKGSTFSFNLPLAGSQHKKRTESLEGLNVLLVENDADTCAMYRDWLESWGAKARSVPGCERAIADFDYEPADLVLTDLFLQDGNGVELLTTLRDARPELATVLCSSSGSIERFLGENDALVNAFVRKPVNQKRMKAALQEAMRQLSLPAVRV